MFDEVLISYCLHFVIIFQQLINFHCGKTLFQFKNENSCLRVHENDGNVKKKSLRKNTSERQLPTTPNYRDLILPKETRNSSNECNSFICLIERNNTSHPNILKDKEHKQIINSECQKFMGLSGAYKFKKMLTMKIYFRFDYFNVRLITYMLIYFQ